MKQEDKELLLKDLCARFPYNCRVFYEYIDDLDGKTYGYSLTLNTWCIDEFVANKAVIKPYLFPMSSMTEEQEKEFNQLLQLEIRAINDEVKYTEVIEFELNLYNKHHLDWRGLIEKGLAIDATGLNVY